MEEDKGQKDEKTELDGPEAETIPLFYHRCEACYIMGSGASTLRLYFPEECDTMV